MNLSILKSPGAWVTIASSIVALLVSQGVILPGSSVGTIISYVLALVGALTGHTLAAPAPAAAATPPAAK